MSTPCVIARPTGDGWKGRYVHWDGDPVSKLKTLRALILRDGVEKVLEVITDQHYGWSKLSYTYDSRDDDNLGARGQAVPGYGLAYTEVDGQSAPDEWITYDCGNNDFGTYWGYVLYPKAITVLKNWGDGEWEVVGSVRNDAELSETDLRKLECGEQYERCPHMAWYHFPELSTECSYTTREWLSQEVHPSLDVATEVILPTGNRVALGGSGGICFSDGTPAWRYDTIIGNRPIYWAKSTKKANGEVGADIIVGRRTKAGLKLKYPIVLPPNAVRGEVVIEAGTVVQQ